MNCVMGFKNAVTFAALSVSSEAPGLSRAQLQNDQGSSSTAWQTNGCVNETILIDVRAGNQWDFQAVGVFRTNLTSAATIAIGIGDDPNNWSYLLPGQSMGILNGYGQSVFVLPTPVRARYCWVEINDPGNPQGYLNIPLMYAGPLWVPQVNYDSSSVYGKDTTTNEVTTRGGQEFPSINSNQRRWDVSLPSINSNNETWYYAMEFDAYIRTGSNALFVPNPLSVDKNHETIFGRAKATSDLGYTSTVGDRRSWKFRITERL